MFVLLLGVTFLIALLVSFIVVRVFDRPIVQILKRLITDEIYVAWQKYLTFAIYVVGISSGVRIWELEKYITATEEKGKIVQLTANRWILEVYRTIVGTLQGVAWLLFIFFVFALVAYVIVRVFELKKTGGG